MSILLCCPSGRQGHMDGHFAGCKRTKTLWLMLHVLCFLSYRHLIHWKVQQKTLSATIRIALGSIGGRCWSSLTQSANPPCIISFFTLNNKLVHMHCLWCSNGIEAAKGQIAKTWNHPLSSEYKKSNEKKGWQITFSVIFRKQGIPEPDQIREWELLWQQARAPSKCIKHWFNPLLF